MAIDSAIFRAYVSTSFLDFRHNGWSACQERCLGFSTRVDHRLDSFDFWTLEILRLCALGHASAYSHAGAHFGDTALGGQQVRQPGDCSYSTDLTPCGFSGTICCMGL